MKEQNQNDVARLMLMLVIIAIAIILTGCEKEPTECHTCQDKWTAGSYSSIRQYNVSDCSADGRTYQQLTEYGIVTVKTTCW